MGSYLHLVYRSCILAPGWGLTFTLYIGRVYWPQDGVLPSRCVVRILAAGHVYIGPRMGSYLHGVYRSCILAPGWGLTFTLYIGRVYWPQDGVLPSRCI